MSVGIDGLRSAVRRIKKIEAEEYNKREDKLTVENRKKAAITIKEIELERKQINQQYNEKIKVKEVRNNLIPVLETMVEANIISWDRKRNLIELLEIKQR